MELRRVYLIQQLNLVFNIYENEEGELLSKLSLNELELVYSRAKDRKGCLG
ncbi:Fur-regulated basic protein FbpA [Anaerobacillus alkalilacustris]|uniref:Fur-regulated basic protein FbpA n=1 Tax=Anaerobacillus alkalilacustris TaxID=393763 RepID=UPI001114300D